MIKIYRYNEYKNHAEVMIRTAGGALGKLIFDNGNVATRTLPTARVTSEFWQQAIEESRYFKNRHISCVQTIKEDDGAKGEEPPSHENENYVAVGDVVSLQQAVDFIADNYREKAHTINEALKIAHSHGVDFPNLKKK